MTRTTLLTSLIATGLLAATPTFAGQWDGHPDMQDSILNNLDQPAFVGTGLTVPRPRVHIYGAIASHDIDTSGFVIGTAGPEKGEGDLYGSILLDLGQ